MDWPMHILLLLLISVSGLFELCFCYSYSNLETAQRFEMCVVGELSQSTLFTEQEKWKMSRIVKETDVRMRRMGVDPTSDSNVRTMLRLFSAALANLVFDNENLIKRCDRKQNYSAALELCSSSLTESTSAELISEVSRIFASMENQKSIKNSNNEETMMPKNLWDKRMASEDSTKKRQKRAPQFSEGFALTPPLDPVIAGVLINSPVFGRTFKNGLTKQDSANYARSMVAAALKDYDYSMTREAMNEVTNAISSLMFMPQTVDYAFAISGSINKVLSARGLASFVDGVIIGNALISKLQEMTETQNPMVSIPSSFGSPVSSSGWESDMRISSQLNIAPPVQISPSWDMPPAPQFQFNPIKQDFGPQTFAVSGSRYPLNPSFAPGPIAPLPGFGSDLSPLENSGMPSFPENIPFGTMASSTASQSAWPQFPFPVDQTFGLQSRFPNQPTTTDKEIPFRFDLSGTQDFSSTSFIDRFPAQQPELLNQPASQDQHTFDSFSSADFQVPTIPKEDTSPFDKTFIKSEISEQTPIPLVVGSLREEIAYPSEDFKAITSESQTTLYKPKEDISKSGETSDPYVTDAISVIYNTLALSDEFASVFGQEISPDDAASLATAMTKFSLSQYNPTVATSVESQVGSAVFSLPLNSSPADYARAIADSFIKAINQNGLLNSINSKSMADSLIAGLRREISNRSTSADSSTVIQNDKSGTYTSDKTSIPLNGGEGQAFADASMPFVSDGSTQESNQQSPKNEPNINTEVSSSNSSLITANTFQKELTNSGQSNSKTDMNPDLSLEIPLRAGQFVPSTQSEQPINKASNLNTTLTVASSETSPPQVIAAPANTKLSKIPDLIEAVLTDPQSFTSAKEAQSPQEKVELFTDEVESSLKTLNQTSEFKQQQNIPTTEKESSTSFTETTQMDEFVPVTPSILNSKPAELDTENTGQSSVDTKVELQPSFLPTTLPLDKTSTEPENSEIITEKTTEGNARLNAEASLYAERVTSIASSAIAYIRSGNINLDELCGKLNILAFVVEIPPVDNCAEIAMIDYLLNVLNAVVFNIRRN